MDIAPKHSTQDSDSNSVYYDAFENLTTASTTTDMHSSRAPAPVTTTPVKPVIGDHVVENEIQARRKTSKDGDDRRGHTSMRRYELVDEGPILDRRRRGDASLRTGEAADVEDEERGDYQESRAIQRQTLNESEGWLPAVDEALPRVPGTRSRSVGQTRSVYEPRHDEMHGRSASLGLGRRGDRLCDDGDDHGIRQRNWGEPGTAKRTASVRSAGTTGTTLTSAFLPNGAGTLKVRADDRGQKNKGKSGFGWGLGIGKKDKIEQEIDKVILAERKTEKRALKDVVKELDELTKVQKGAVKNESRAQTKLTSLLSTLYKSELAYLDAKREYETTLAAVCAQQKVVEKVREGANEATERIREKAGEVSALRDILKRDEGDRVKS